MTTTITDMLSEIDTIAEAAAQRDRAAAEQRQAAESARERTDQLVQQAEDAARLGQNEVLQRFHPIMRELSQQVSDARSACIDAISRGESAVDCWIKYRLAAARVRGQWSSLSDDYRRLTGRDAPPGPSIPELRAETFDQLVRVVLPQAERVAYAEGCTDVVKAKEAHRAKAEAAKQATPPKAG